MKRKTGKKRTERDRLIDRINSRIKAIKSNNFTSYVNLGEKQVSARVKFGAKLTDSGFISKSSKSTLKQLKAIEKQIPTIQRINVKIEVAYYREKQSGINVSRETFTERVKEISDFFEKIEFQYSDRSQSDVDDLKSNLMEHHTYDEVYNAIRKFKEGE